MDRYSIGSPQTGREHFHAYVHVPMGLQREARQSCEEARKALLYLKQKGALDILGKAAARAWKQG